MDKFKTPPVVFVLEEQIEKLEKQLAEKDKEIEKLLNEKQTKWRSYELKKQELQQQVDLFQEESRQYEKSIQKLTNSLYDSEKQNQKLIDLIRGLLKLFSIEYINELDEKLIKKHEKLLTEINRGE